MRVDMPRKSNKARELQQVFLRLPELLTSLRGMAWRTTLILMWCALGCTAYGQEAFGLIEHSAEVQPGYNLWSVGEASYLVDNCGREVHRWEHDAWPGLSVYFEADGTLLRTKRLPSTMCSGCSQGGGIQRIAPDGTVLWEATMANDSIQAHHDIEPLPNGNILVILWERVSADEAIALGRDPSTIPPEDELYTLMIWEIQPLTGEGFEIVWEWHAIDHVIQDLNPDAPHYGLLENNPGKISIHAGWDTADWLHANAIDFHPERDEIAICMRHSSEVFVIDHGISTQAAAGPAGDLIWRFGNSNNLGESVGNILGGPHDVRWIGPGLEGEGNLMVFDNFGLGGQQSRVLELAPPLDENEAYIWALDSVSQAETVVWEWSMGTDFYSSNVSGATRQPNGNTLMCEGDDGRFWEINPNGEVIWKYRNPALSTGDILAQEGSVPPGTSNTVFRVTRILPDHPGLATFDLEPGLPLESDPLPLPVTCAEVSVAEAYRFQPNAYPNPVARGAIVRTGANPLVWAWYDALGRLVEQGQTSALRAPRQSGNYVLKLTTPSGQTFHRMVVE